MLAGQGEIVFPSRSTDGRYGARCGCQRRGWPHGGRSFACVLAPCEVAHRSISIAHLGNIAMQLGRDLKWDPRKERFVSDAEANKMLSRPYCAPWKLG